MMDIKNLYLKLKVTREQRDKFFLTLFKSRRLFFLCALGVAMVYVFNLLYNKAFVEINYVEYPAQVETVNVHRESAALEAIMKKVEERKQNLELIKGKTYSDLFNFKKDTRAQTAQNDGAAEGEADARANDAAATKNPEAS